MGNHFATKYNCTMTDQLLAYLEASPFAWVGAFLVASLLCRLLADRLDRRRVGRYIGRMGGELHRISWSPFGPGWFGERNARIYLIQYTDREESLHSAFVKTSLLSGVYLTRDVEIR